MGRGEGGARPGDKVEYVMVASNKVGLVIGKGGKNIKSIIQTSGAHVEVDRNALPDAQETKVFIKGSTEAVEEAKRMVLLRVDAYHTLFVPSSLLNHPVSTRHIEKYVFILHMRS